MPENKSVVRNAQYRRGGLNVRERHNERKNADYQNEDIIKERAAYNVYIKQSTGSYENTFNTMISDKTISTRGLGKDPFIVDELVFDVNTAYFEQNGGYEYAKRFYEEAYRCAVKEIGGEQYVLSAVMHADERNKALSERLGFDVYHYHLHVMYVPVVQKEVYFRKNNKNPELAGKLKEVITQVSHSKKWPRFKANGHWVNSYSLLQNRFYDHMKEAGFTGFERGERGSTTEHLTVLECKTQKEAERAAAMTALAEQKQEVAAALDEQTEKKAKRLEKLDEQITVKTKATATISEIDAVGKPALLGGFNVPADELNKLKTLAKKAVKADEKVSDMKRKLDTAVKERDEAQSQLAIEKKQRPSITERLSWFDKFTTAMKRAPKRLMAVIDEILRQPPEIQEPRRTSPEQKRNKAMEV